MEFAQAAISECAESMEIDSENHFGLSCSSEKAAMFWAEWWLACGSILVYITYNAKPETRSDKFTEARRIVDSLRITGVVSSSEQGLGRITR
jgi:hypothetical protein